MFFFCYPLLAWSGIPMKAKFGIFNRNGDQVFLAVEGMMINSVELFFFD